MLTIRFLRVALALLAAPLLLAGDACAQQPPPATTPAAGPPVLPARSANIPQRAPEITFYVAHGEANACGVGCSEWIAAQGTIDQAAPARLHRLLDTLGARQPPIFLDSPGGAVGPSLQLGRLLRERRMEVSVGRTIPRECDPDKLVDTACEALKRSGRELEAELDLTRAICMSGCVWAFAGGAVRYLPPWVRLGVHDVGVGSGLYEAPSRNANLAGARSVWHARMALYLGQMGLDYGVYSASLAVPFESLRFLDRDETIRFGLDTRTFAETVWKFGDKPAAGVTKQYFGPGGNPELPYPNATVQLSCAAGGATRLSIADQRVPQQATPGVPVAAPPPPASAPPLHVTIGGQRLDLIYAPRPGIFTVRAVTLPADVPGAIVDRDTIEVAEDDPAPGAASAKVTTLSMVGFAAAFAKLKTACEQAVACAPGDVSARCVPAAGSGAGTRLSGPPPQPAPAASQAKAEPDSGWSFVAGENPRVEMTLGREVLMERLAYRRLRLSLTCGTGGLPNLYLESEVLPSEVGLRGPRLLLSVDGQAIAFAAVATPGKGYLGRSARLPAGLADAVGDNGVIEFSTVTGRGPDTPRSWSLMFAVGTKGFPAAYAQLRKTCAPRNAL